MSHGVDSLNVAAASAVAFWQLRAPSGWLPLTSPLYFFALPLLAAGLLSCSPRLMRPLHQAGIR